MIDRPHQEPAVLHEDPDPLMPHHKAIAWSTFALALGLRLLCLFQLRHSPFWSDLPVDLGYYHDWATRILEGNDPPGLFEQSPFYAYYLAAIFGLAGKGFLIPRLIQAVIGSLTCVLVYRIGRHAVSPSAGALAGLLASLYGPFLFYDTMLMKTVFAVFFLTSMLDQLVRSGGWRRGSLALAGLCLGLGALVRDNVILLAPCLAAWIVIAALVGDARLHTRGVRDILGAVGAFAAGILLIVGPMAIRNHAVSGKFVLLTAGGGEVFYIGNNPHADGYYSPPPFVRAGSSIEHEDFRVEAARRLGRPAGSIAREEASDFWLRQGLDWIRTNPGDFARLLGRKLLILMNHYELPDNHSYAHHRRFIPLLRWPLPVFGALLPLAAAGLILSAGRWRDTLPIYVTGAGYIASVLVFFNFGRFRMPLIPVLLVLAGSALALVLPAWHAGRRVTLALAALAAVLTTFVTMTDLGHDPVHLGQSDARLASLLLSAGRPDEAEVVSRRGIERLESFYVARGGHLEEGSGGLAARDRPDLGASYYEVLAEAYRTHGAILRALGSESDALAYERRARIAVGGITGPHPGSDTAAMMRSGQARMSEGRFAEAVIEFRSALDDPGESLDPVTRLSMSLRLAEALHRSGHPHEALDIVEEALDRMDSIPPREHAAAHYGRALIRRDLGEMERMRFHLRECLRLDPDHPRADWIRKTLSEE